MIKENNEEFLISNYLSSESETFTKMLGSLMVIEIGTITAAQEGRASIEIPREVADGMPLTLDDVELLFPGNSRGGAFTQVIGSLCLLLCPRTLVEDTRNMLVRPDIKTVHSSAGIKAIPLSNIYRNSVQMDYDDDGGMHISAGKGAINISPDGCITLRYDDHNITVFEDSIKIYANGPAVLRYNKDGSIIEYQWNNMKPTYLRIRTVDGTETIYRNGLEDATFEQWEDITTYEKWQWIEEYNADGTQSTTLKDADGNVIYTITKQPDGSDDTSSTAPYSVVVTDSDGKEQVTIKATNDGKLSITTEDAVSIAAKGDVTVTSEGAINVEATKQGLLTLKNSVDSLGKILTTLCDNISQIDTVGSPASHSAGPGIIANMTMLKQKIGQVLG